jgi:hypothetical protein
MQDDNALLDDMSLFGSLPGTPMLENWMDGGLLLPIPPDFPPADFQDSHRDSDFDQELQRLLDAF